MHAAACASLFPPNRSLALARSRYGRQPLSPHLSLFLSLSLSLSPHLSRSSALSLSLPPPSPPRPRCTIPSTTKRGEEIKTNVNGETGQDDGGEDGAEDDDDIGDPAQWPKSQASQSAISWVAERGLRCGQAWSRNAPEADTLERLAHVV